MKDKHAVLERAQFTRRWKKTFHNTC